MHTKLQKLLAIDTSTSVASYAITDGVNIISSARNDVREHATFILQDLDDLLQQLKLSIADLDGIVFSMGPGSFTGLRVACMVAKGLSYPYKLPILGVSGLQAMIDNFDKYPVISMIDARMHQVYWLFQLEPDHVMESPKVGNINDLLTQDMPDFHVISYSCNSYLENLTTSMANKILSRENSMPTAIMLLNSVKKGNYQLYDSITAEPLYVRNTIVQQN